MTTLRYKRSLKIFATILTLIVLGFVLYIIASAPSVGYVFSAQVSILWVASLCLMLISLTIIFLVVLAIVSVWSYRIEFSDAFLEANGTRTPFSRYFRCAYEDITAVRRGERGYIEVVPAKGKALVLAPQSFEGGEVVVFGLLHRYIPAEHFEPDLSNSFKRVTRREKIILPLTFLCIFSYLSLLIIDNRGGISPFTWNWNAFSPWTFSSENISGFTVESSSSVWIVTRDYVSEQLTINHLDGNKTQSWTIPGNEMSGTNARHVQILVDSKQQPVLVGQDNLYVPAGTAWGKIPYPAGYSADLDRLSTASNLSNEIWAVLTNQELDHPDLLIHIQADHPQPQPVELADPETHQLIRPQKIVPAPDGSFLLQDGKRIYVIRNGTIQLHYDVMTRDQLGIEDFTLLNNKELYVLLSSFPAQEGSVERIDAQGQPTLTQLPMVAAEPNGPERFYESIEVDSHGRLWIGGNYPYFMAVFEPDWQGTARKMVEYNEYNSSYQNGGYGSDVVMSSDGRIWSADDRLVWIDSNAAELPEPLPDWLAKARQDFVLSRIAIALLVLSVLSNYLLLLPTRAKKK